MSARPSPTATPRGAASTALLCCALLLGCGSRVEIPDGPHPGDPATAWAKLLNTASGRQGVDYDLIDQQREALEHYLAYVAVHGELSDGWRESKEDKRVAALLNAYNAAVVYGVLINRPITSVHDVKVGLLPAKGAGFFLGQRFKVDGQWSSLYTLEHQRIVARYQDPLVHVALNCASRGCPPLRWWDSRGLQGRLRSAMRKFIASDQGMVATGPLGADGVPETFAASSIFDWYSKDFTDWSDAVTVCDWMATYAKGAKRTWLTAHKDDCPLQFQPYDWSLNQAPVPAPITTPSHAATSSPG
jgi:Protein of unknown function, DUF547.